MNARTDTSRPSKRTAPHHAASRFHVPTYICQSCGQQCRLPFTPRRGKPVTCTDCWKANHSPTGRREPVHHLPLTPPADRMYKAGLSWKWKPKT